jgi:hypothetical protein
MVFNFYQSYMAMERENRIKPTGGIEMLKIDSPDHRCSRSPSLKLRWKEGGNNDSFFLSAEQLRVKAGRTWWTVYWQGH